VPEVVTGLIGAATIGAAVVSSVLARGKEGVEVAEHVSAD
jgi:hypothetical protein